MLSNILLLVNEVIYLLTQSQQQTIRLVKNAIVAATEHSMLQTAMQTSECLECRPHRKVGDLIIRLLISHDIVQQLRVVAERGDAEHAAYVWRQVVWKQLHCKQSLSLMISACEPLLQHFEQKTMLGPVRHEVPMA